MAGGFIFKGNHMIEYSNSVAATLAGPHYLILTGAASHRNPEGAGGWAALICEMRGTQEIGRVQQVGCDQGPISNVRMEMTAVARAIELVGESSTNNPPVVVRPRLEMISKGMTIWLPSWASRNWKTFGGQPVANTDLWRRISRAANSMNVYWDWDGRGKTSARGKLIDHLASSQMREAAKNNTN